MPMYKLPEFRISIHAAQEGCDSTAEQFVLDVVISIHAAQEGCDITVEANSYDDFLISIHAAQEGCDFGPNTQRSAIYQFQSTQPKRAATLASCRIKGATAYFNPRSPRGLRLQHKAPSYKAGSISIHAAQEGCDR